MSRMVWQKFWNVFQQLLLYSNVTHAWQEAASLTTKSGLSNCGGHTGVDWDWQWSWWEKRQWIVSHEVLNVAMNAVFYLECFIHWQGEMHECAKGHYFWCSQGVGWFFLFGAWFRQWWVLPLCLIMLLWLTWGRWEKGCSDAEKGCQENALHMRCVFWGDKRTYFWLSKARTQSIVSQTKVVSKVMSQWLYLAGATHM